VKLLFLRISWGEIFIHDWLRIGREREQVLATGELFHCSVNRGDANWNGFYASCAWLHRIDYNLSFGSVNWIGEASLAECFNWHPHHFPGKAICRPVPQGALSPKPCNCSSCSLLTWWYAELWYEYAVPIHLMLEIKRPTCAKNRLWCSVRYS
jgi:hypothetical protein